MIRKAFKKIDLILYRLTKGIYYKLRFAQFGKHAILRKPTTIDNPERIFIGNQVVISYYGCLAANPLTGNDNCKLIIGDGTYVGRFCHIYATSRIEIQNKVLIADKVYISDNLHGYQDINIAIIDQAIVQANELVIGEGAWLGENVCVIGASVGKHSIIGANSVVNKDIPDYCIAVGSPAKIIKRYNFEKNIWQKTTEKGEFI